MYKFRLFLLCCCVILPFWAYGNDPVIQEDGFFNIPSSEGFANYISQTYTHECSPDNNIFLVKGYDLNFKLDWYGRKQKLITPQNKMVWNVHVISENAYVVVNGKRTYPKMPSFECTLAGNTIKIQYVYGAGSSEKDMYIAYGDTYPKPSDMTEDDVYISKIFAIFVNDKQITQYWSVDMDRYGSFHKFTYQFDEQKKQYYIHILTGDYPINGHYPKDTKPTPYAYSHGNTVQYEFANKGMSKMYTIKIYDNIKQN